MGNALDDVYRRLAAHLDRMPGGFPPSSTGAELPLLRRLFTPEEAALAPHLTLERETAEQIARRAGLAAPQAVERLAGMAHKGLIFSAQSPDGQTVYQAVPFVVGIYEFQVGRLSPGLLRDLGAYWTSQQPRQPQGVPQMRTIPVRQRVDVPLEALPYERVDEVLRSHSRYAVAPCICRRQARMLGRGCDAPTEACLLFDEWAEFYVAHNEGRFCSLDEIRHVVDEADRANLVLQPSNCQQAAFVCCCCSCCCGVLRGIKAFPQPARIVASPFVARLDEEACEDCRRCLDRCPMGAVSLQAERLVLEAERCIGCGLCTSTCPSGALRLERKPASLQVDVPLDMTATWKSIGLAQDAHRQVGAAAD